MKSPCQNCPHNRVMCHRRCDEWLEYHEALLDAKQALKHSENVIDYLIRQAEKKRRRK